MLKKGASALHERELVPRRRFKPTPGHVGLWALNSLSVRRWSIRERTAPDDESSGYNVTYLVPVQADWLQPRPVMNSAGYNENKGG